MRAVQRHIGKHIPGRPDVVPVNMPGAASLTMLNHIANIALRDGSVIGMPSRGLVVEPLLGNTQARFDGTKLSWVGSVTRDVSVCVTWHKSGITSLEDARGRDVLVGSTGFAADSAVFPLLINQVTGTRIKPISGYADSTAVGIAMERGELDGYCGFTVSAIKTARPQWIQDKLANLIVQISLTAHPDLPNVPVIYDLARDERQRQTLSLAFGTQEMGRPVVAPPGVPSEVLKALRAAFDDTMKDPEFLAYSARSGLEVTDPISGEAVQKIVEKLYATHPEAIQTFKQIRDARQ